MARLVVAVCLFTLCACTPAATIAPAGESAARGATTQATEMVEPAPPVGIYVSLVDGRVHAFADGAAVGPYVRVERSETGLIALSDVEGASVAADVVGHPGYFELTVGRFMGAEVARAPTPPYVEGTMTADGFVVSSTIVVR